MKNNNKDSNQACSAILIFSAAAVAADVIANTGLPLAVSFSYGFCIGLWFGSQPMLCLVAVITSGVSLKDKCLEMLEPLSYMGGMSTTCLVLTFSIAFGCGLIIGLTKAKCPML